MDISDCLNEDGGNSWNEVFPLGIDINIVGMHFLNQFEGWVISNGGSNGPEDI